jgi:Pvc16 N-terminal domain
VRADREAISNALVLASVTAVLKNLLENGLVSRGVTANIGGDTVISALPPDRITTGEEERAQLNLFLYDIRLKGLDVASRYAPADRAQHPLPAPPVFELSYLLTAYGAQDFHTEVLMGYAIELLREKTVLTGDAIRNIFASLAKTDGGRVVLPALAALADSDLARRIEQIKVSPQILNPEEMSRLWTSLQARYRPSAAYKISVFVRDGDRSTEEDA